MSRKKTSPATGEHGSSRASSPPPVRSARGPDRSGLSCCDQPACFLHPSSFIFALTTTPLVSRNRQAGSYKRGCQEKRPPRPPENTEVLVHPAPPRYVRLVVLTVLAFRVATSRHASSIPAVSSLRLRRRPWFPETGKRGGCRVGNHGPIGDSWPIAFLGYPRGHRVFIETRCRWHTGPNYAMDALPRTRASQEPIGHRRR